MSSYWTRNSKFETSLVDRHFDTIVGGLKGIQGRTCVHIERLRANIDRIEDKNARLGLSCFVFVEIEIDHVTNLLSTTVHDPIMPI